MRNKKLLIAGLICICVVYILFVISLFQKCIPIDSDYSNLVLEGNDILGGNVFLKGWNLTGISFLTTDLLFFVIGSAIAGVSIQAYYIAAGLMTAVVVLIGWLLCEPFRNRCFFSCLYILLAAIPGIFALTGLRAHTGAVCWALLSIWFIDRYIKNEKVRDAAAACVFLTLGCLGDMLTVLAGVLPVMLLMVKRLLCASGIKEMFRDQAARGLGIISVLSVVLSLFLDKVYFKFGGANKNSFLEEKAFESIDSLGYKVSIYIKSILMFEDADFFEQKLLSVQTVSFFLNTLIVIIGFWIVVYNIVRFVKCEDYDCLSVLLSLGFLVVSVVFIITNISVDVYSSRYLAYTPILFSILIVRYLAFYSGTYKEYKGKVLPIFMLGISAIIFIFRIYTLWNYPVCVSPQEELVQELERRGLENGYSSFWNSSVSTVLSNEKVTLRAIQSVYCGSGVFDYYNWFCKDKWYQEKSDYVVAQENDIYGVTPEAVEAFFGHPKEMVKCGGWYIMLYDQDLSDMLLVNQ